MGSLRSKQNGASKAFQLGIYYLWLRQFTMMAAIQVRNGLALDGNGDLEMIYQPH